MFLNFNNYKLDTGRRLLHDLTYMGHFFFFLKLNSWRQRGEWDQGLKDLEE